MTDNIELYHARLETTCADAEDAYFSARPMLERTRLQETLFRAGFRRAYDLFYRGESEKTS